MPSPARSVPLSSDQVRLLRAEIGLPAIGFVPILTLAGVLLSRTVFGPPQPLAVRIVGTIATVAAAAAAIGIGVHIRNHLRDLRAKVALIQTARLVAKTVSRWRYTRTCNAEFEEVGRLVVDPDVCTRLSEGQTYTVTFSPMTRQAWFVEELPVTSADDARQ